MNKLSKRQQEVYNYIKSYITDNGFSPSLADIAMGLNLHDSTIAVYVETLKRKGFVKSEYRIARSLQITKPHQGGDGKSENVNAESAPTFTNDTAKKTGTKKAKSGRMALLNKHEE